MRWAVVGSRGMLGSDLVEYLESRGEAVTGFHRDNLVLGPRSEKPMPELNEFDVVVNCVAYTKVDLAEDEPEKAHLSNVLVPIKLAVELQDQPTRLIQISTDYVFDGTKQSPYLPEDKRNPLGVYGKTKANAEELLEAFPKAQVIRTSWLYGKNGQNFPKTIGAKLARGEEVGVVSDQFGSPTHTVDLAEFIYRAAKAPLDQRVLHGVSSGSTSWFGFAQAIAASIGAPGAVRAVSSSEYPTRALRPGNSVLEPSKVDGWQIGDWDGCWVAAASSVLATKPGS
jgi:dTDP-4-dehydrorhamnose reductase